ncbi:MAG: hypothetical protein ABF820_11240 [Sporolactobacillus sp.]
MRALIYQIMEQPDWLKKIKKGTFKFSATVAEEEKQAMIKAAVNYTSSNKSHYWHEF